MMMILQCDAQHIHGVTLHCTRCDYDGGMIAKCWILPHIYQSLHRCGFTGRASRWTIRRCGRSYAVITCTQRSFLALGLRRSGATLHTKRFGSRRRGRKLIFPVQAICHSISQFRTRILVILTTIS
jgi:hypothetical protein